MKFSVASDWSIELLDGLSKCEEVEDVFAKLPVDLVGGGRFPVRLPKIDIDDLNSYVEECHKRNIEFTYLLNSPCFALNETKDDWRKKFSDFMDKIVEAEIDRVTVANPLLVNFIKKRYPHLKINISCIAVVNSIKRAQWYADLGADEIAWDFQTVQRNFPLMKSMIKSVNVEFQLMVGNACLYNCPLRFYHANSQGHASQSMYASNPFDYCVLNCFSQKINNPTELIRSLWVRPEDLHYYEKIGVSKIKITERTAGSAWILRAVNAYSNRSYEGNLLDVVSTAWFDKSALGSIKLEEEEKAVLFRWSDFLKKQKPFYIDNSKLDSFLPFFQKNECHLTDCKKCNYCSNVAKKVLSSTLTKDQKQDFELFKNTLKNILTKIHLFEDQLNV